MNLLNVPPQEFVRVMPDALRSFTAALFRKVDMPEEDARLLAELLVASDLRGVHSHGSLQATYYISQFRKKELNARPRVGIVQETETTAVLDGDGGLGYFPAFRAAHLAVEKAKRHGMGAATTRNHGHYGAAAHYSRIAVAADCIGISASGSRYLPSRDSCVWAAAGCPPVSIAVPSGNEPPIAPDMGIYILLSKEASFEDLFGKIPSVFFKFLGLGVAVQALGGMLAGIYGQEGRFVGANQGAFIAAIDVGRFLPLDEFKRHVDRFMASARNMKPFPGYERAELAGNLEWQLEREYARKGIPLSPDHRKALDACAKELNVERLVTSNQ